MYKIIGECVRKTGYRKACGGNLMRSQKVNSHGNLKVGPLFCLKCIRYVNEAPISK